MRPLQSLVSFACALSLLACQPPSPEEVAKKTATDTTNLLREAWQALEQTNRWTSVDDTVAGFGLPRSASQSPRIPPVSQFDSGTDTMSAIIKRVFTEANVVSREGGSVTFRVRGVDACADANGRADQGCADWMDRMQPQVKVSGDLDLTLLVGAERAQLAVVRLRSGKSLAVEFDFATLKQVAAITQQAANPNATSSLGFDATGRLEVKLEKNGDQDFTWSHNLLSDATVAVRGTDGVQRTFSLAARSPMQQVRIEAAARRATVLVDLAAARYTGLLDELGLSRNTGRPVDIALAGFTVELKVDDSGARLSRVALGSGASSVRSGNDVLFQADLNAALDRAFAASWTTTADGLRVAVTPGLTVDATVNLGVLAGPDFRPPEMWRHAKYTAAFQSASRKPTMDLITRPASSSSSNAVARLVDGAMTLAVDTLSPCSGVNNVDACNRFRDEYGCGASKPSVDCASFASNACDNAAYFSCIGTAFTCNGGSVFKDQQQFDRCRVVTGGPVAPRTFAAPSCMGGASGPVDNPLIDGVAAVACP